MSRPVTQITVRMPGRELPFVCLPTKLSVTVCSEVLSGKTYPLFRFIGDVRVIVDVGANVGAAAVYFALNYPDAVVHAMEPAREPFELLQRNAGHFANVRPEMIGFYSRNITTPLYSGPMGSETASVGQSGLNGEGSEPVQLRRADEWLRERGIERVDVLKLDSEGCEIPILESLRPILPGIRVIYVEYHSEDDRLGIDRLLSASHILSSGKAAHLHRGEFCYVSKLAFPSASYRDRFKITVDL